MVSSKVLKKLAVGAIVVGAGYYIKSQAQTGDPLWTAAGWLLFALVVVRVGLALKRGAAIVRAKAASGVSLENVDVLATEMMPAQMRGYWQAEKTIYAAFWRAITLRSVNPSGTFALARGPRGMTIAAGWLLLVAILGPVLTMALLVAMPASWPQWPTEAGVALLALYAAIWVIGDRRALREGGHTVGNGALTLRLGVRSQASVAVADIARCAPFGTASAGPEAQVWQVSPGEVANVLVELHAVMRIDAVWFGYPRALDKRFIALYVDQPDAFIAALDDAIGQVVQRQAA